MKNQWQTRVAIVIVGVTRVVVEITAELVVTTLVVVRLGVEEFILSIKQDNKVSNTHSILTRLQNMTNFIGFCMRQGSMI